MNNDSPLRKTLEEHLRHARMLRQTAVLMSRCGDVWQTDLKDISATGAKLARPAGWEGKPGDVWSLDMLFDSAVNVNVMAEVVRIGEHHIGFAFARIPEAVQRPLWTLLGGYADKLEPWDDSVPDM
ncbi:MAG TPA: PilZ domain-containing protein [Rhodanobacteraceae bacterium]